MNSRTARIRGFTLTETIIASAIISLFIAIASFSAIGYRDRMRAKVCIGNQAQIFNALAEYGNNNALAVGATVTIARLVSSGYLKSVGGSTWVCPACNLPYAPNQFYGVAPRCPGNILTHVFSVTNAPSP